MEPLELGGRLVAPHGYQQRRGCPAPASRKPSQAFHQQEISRGGRRFHA